MIIKGYSDLSLSRSTARNDIVCNRNWGAHLKFNDDIGALFPYINSSLEGVHYKDRPLHVSFQFKQVKCTLFPREAILSPFSGKSHAVEFIEGLIRFLNGLYDKREELEPSYKVHQQTASVVDIIQSVPKTNCRECGYNTCLLFAVALNKNEITPNKCPYFAKPIATYEMYPILGANGSIRSRFLVSQKTVVNHRPTDEITKEAPRSKEKNKTVSVREKPLFDPGGIRIKYDLTPREKEVLHFVAEGATNSDISRTLNISPHTVKSHVIHIFNKLNVNDRTQAAVWAVQNKII